MLGRRAQDQFGQVSPSRPHPTEDGCIVNKPYPRVMMDMVGLAYSQGSCPLMQCTDR